MKIEPQDLARLNDATVRQLVDQLHAKFDDDTEAISALMRTFGDALLAGLDDRHRTLQMVELDLAGIEGEQS